MSDHAPSEQTDHQLSPALPDETIERVTADDYAELIDHLGGAFADRNFASRLPALYTRTAESMGRFRVIRRRGQIVAAAGRFDLAWQVGRTQLRLAGIGGVSVQPAHEGQGLMRQLMAAIVQEIEAGDFDAAYLTGARRRYQHWGFEKAGCEAELTLTSNSLHQRVRFDSRLNDVTISPMCDADADEVYRLHASQPITCERGPDAMPSFLANWRHEAWVLRAGGRCVGYACVDRPRQTVVEFGIDALSWLDTLIAALHEELDGVVRFRRPMLLDACHWRLRELSDGLTLSEAGNWRLFDVPRVLTASMRLAHRCRPLTPGRLSVELTDLGRAVQFEVDGEQVRCVATEASAEMQMTCAELLQSLTGPVTTANDASLLDAWRSLPLWLPPQDRV